MRRRAIAAGNLTAEQVVDLAEQTPGRAARYGSAEADRWRAVLAEHGVTPLDVFRARLELRRTAPARGRAAP